MHPKAFKAYQEAGFEKQPTVEDQVEENFWRRTQGSAIERKILTVYRVKHGARDYITFFAMLVAVDLLGNEINMTKLYGKYKMPRFQQRLNPETGQRESGALVSEDDEYWIPFSRKTMQRVLKSATLPADTKYCLDAGYVKYGGGFTPMEFMTKNFDDLLEKVENDRYPDKETAVVEDKATERALKDFDELEETEWKASEKARRRLRPVYEEEQEEEQERGTRLSDHDDSLLEEDSGISKETAEAYGQEKGKQQGQEEKVQQRQKEQANVVTTTTDKAKEDSQEKGTKR